jgi:predicted amidohydrolase YtcJ
VLIAGAEVEGVAPLDVRLDAGRVAAIARELPRRPGEPVLAAGGGALLPGLHDHHLHLFALAAAEGSVRCGPPEVRDARALARALAAATDRDGWIRGTGYHESVAGPLDRTRLDALAPDPAVRIQHRSGALWILNSAGVERLGLDRGADRPGVERDAAGRATGRLFRLDGWLRERIESRAPPDLAAVSRRLAAFGVTGVTDATAGNAGAEARAFATAQRKGELLQHLVVMGTPGLRVPSGGRIERGALKVMLEEHALPPFEELQAGIEAAHREERPVAVHCVTRAVLVLACEAFRRAGTRPGDRIEHAAVAPPAVLSLLARLPLAVVTQPHFVRERGDAYLEDVEPGDRPWLYRCRGFLEAGVPLAAGTDAPFGHPDPWRAMQAAVDRRTEAGRTLGLDERLTPEQALALFTSPPAAPGAGPRAIAFGAPADLCLLDRPWSAARSQLSSALVAATVRDGSIVWRRP